MRCFIHAAMLGVIVSAAAAHGDAATTVRAQHRRTHFIADAHRPLATLPPAATPWHHTNEAPSVGNGRLFRGGVVTRTPEPVIDWPGPGPERYGAANDDNSLIHARVGRAVLSFSPWMTYQHADTGRLDLRRRGGGAWSRRPARVSQGFSSPAVERALGDIRHARNIWLRERGYVGGVRTFKNPVRASADRSSATPEPAGWFRRPAEFPRTRSTEHVRLSLPPGMDPAAASRLRSMHAETIVRGDTRPRRTEP